MLRSIGAILAAYVTTVILTLITIPLVGAIFPASLNPQNTGWVLANVGYGALFALIAGYVCAYIAQKAEMRHVLILAGIMLVLSIMTFIASLPYLEETGQPAWYYPLLMLTGTPATILGGYLRLRQKMTPVNLA
jgi:vacuolar-type H+-ATPase subunit I/STV1